MENLKEMGKIFKISLQYSAARMCFFVSPQNFNLELGLQSFAFQLH